MKAKHMTERLATEVMGWTRVPDSEIGLGSYTQWQKDGERVASYGAWNPLADWNATMEIMEKAREKFTIHINVIGEGYDEKQHQVSLFSRDRTLRPEKLKCEHCPVHPVVVSKSEDRQFAICDAILEAYNL